MTLDEQTAAVCDATLATIAELQKSGLTEPSALLNGVAAALGNAVALFSIPGSREFVLSVVLSSTTKSCRGRALRDGATEGQG